MQVQAHREQFELRLEEKDAQLKESLRQAAEVGCEAACQEHQSCEPSNAARVQSLRTRHALACCDARHSCSGEVPVLAHLVFLGVLQPGLV